MDHQQDGMSAIRRIKSLLWRIHRWREGSNTAYISYPWHWCSIHTQNHSTKLMGRGRRGPQTDCHRYNSRTPHVVRQTPSNPSQYHQCPQSCPTCPGYSAPLPSPLTSLKQGHGFRICSSMAQRTVACRMLASYSRLLCVPLGVPRDLS